MTADPNETSRNSEVFNAHLYHASKEVESWPPWKRHVLGTPTAPPSTSTCTDADTVVTPKPSSPPT